MLGQQQSKPQLQFAEQQPGEVVLLHRHRHWWTFARVAWLPFLALPALAWLIPRLALAQPAANLLLLLGLALPLLALLYLHREWRNDAVIVTDQRIIRVQRTILTLFRQVTQVKVDSVHEVQVELPAYDPIARLLRYGTVVVKTAGAQGNLNLPHMPQPQAFQKLLIENRQQIEQSRADSHQQLVQAEMQRWAAGEESPSPSAGGTVAPRPVQGGGYLSNRIVMNNGDIVYRKHPSVWARHTALPLLLIIVALVALLLSFTVAEVDLRALLFPAAMVALLLGSLSYYWQDWDWRNDITVISDDTITIEHKRPFFLQNLREQILVERIDNVESERRGLLAALLKMGDLRLSLIGADEPTVFSSMAKPQELQAEIARRQASLRQRRVSAEAQQQQALLERYLGAAPADSARSTGAYASLQQEPPAAQLWSLADNVDRNRPPGLPRKVQAASPIASAANLNMARGLRRSHPQ